MNKLITTLLALAVASAMVTTAFAQNAGPGQGGRQGQGQPGRQGQQGQQRMAEIEKKVLESLNLTATQKEQLTKLNAEIQKDRENLRKKFQGQGQNVDREGLRAEMQKIQKKREDGMKKILGDAKFKEYQTKMQAEIRKLREQQGGRQGGQGGGRRGGGSTGGGN
ncbi:MAG: hypothetical protein MUC92_04490 [Fimbriimonadaceae bacterium]|jgi:hypothetical protein|nr:hypothetical protein [Fimbriimonadaceae bacterium]